MSWLPKGERPPPTGRWWMKDEHGKVRGVIDFDVLPIHASVLAIEIYDSWSFAPAVPPPEWDLETALIVELGFHGAWPRRALSYVRAWVAGEKKPC